MLAQRKNFQEKPRKKWLKLIIIVILLAILVGVSYAIINDIEAKKAEQARIEAEIARIEAKKIEPVYITLPGAQTITALRDNYNSTDSIWMLVNKTHPISTDFEPNVTIPAVNTRTDKSNNEQSVRTDIKEAVETMFNAATADGHPLMIASGYRPASLQRLYYDSAVASSGEAAAAAAVAYPGQSEHQTGLALDISTLSKSCYLDYCFTATAEGEWLATNSYKYGFILRYPEGKESITGYKYEPWHFRYVGVDLATALKESNLTLEEAWPYLEQALQTLKDNGATI